MKRKNRIRKNTDFKKIIAKRNIKKNNEFVIYTDINKFGYARFGYSVSSKIGNAVVRNRIKRQIRSMSNILVNLDKNVDIVIIVRDGYKKNSYQQNLKSLKGLLQTLQ